MHRELECLSADVGGLRLFAYVSFRFVHWSAAIYDRTQDKFVWIREPLVDGNDLVDKAMQEAETEAAVRFGCRAEGITADGSRGGCAHNADSVSASVTLP